MPATAHDDRGQRIIQGSAKGCRRRIKQQDGLLKVQHQTQRPNRQSGEGNKAVNSRNLQLMAAVLAG